MTEPGMPETMPAASKTTASGSRMATFPKVVTGTPHGPMRLIFSASELRPPEPELSRPV
jgi:hypothetical protein